MLKVANSVISASQIQTPITFAGDVTLSTGNLVIGTSGKGIDFSATSHPAGMTSELLADYEEGTWTPVLGGSGGTSGQTYSLQSGRYTKIGRQVICNFEVVLTAVGTVTNYAAINGLPFTVTAGSTSLDGGSTTVTFASGFATNQIYVSGYLINGETRAWIVGIAAAGTNIDNILATNIWGNTTRIAGTISFTAS
jgi:hypothetical protein